MFEFALFFNEDGSPAPVASASLPTGFREAPPLIVISALERVGKQMQPRRLVFRRDRVPAGTDSCQRRVWRYTSTDPLPIGESVTQIQSRCRCSYDAMAMFSLSEDASSDATCVRCYALGAAALASAR
jgi:hypothetical protein